MIETLISSKTRVKLLMKFFINANTTAYLRSLHQEFGESTNAIRVELNRLEQAGMLRSSNSGNKKIFQANRQHPLFDEIHNILLKQIGLDRVIEQVIERLGQVEEVYLTGDFARGMDSPVIDLLIVGNIDRAYLLQLIEKAEKAIHRKIRYLNCRAEEVAQFTPSEADTLLLWAKTD
jgi:hypothetical protein